MRECTYPKCHIKTKTIRCAKHKGKALPVPVKRKRGLAKSGDTKLTDDGYIWEFADEHWQAQHKIVMERMLGRELIKGVESVHHKNGLRHDNRPLNLELWVGGIRYGQRASEIFCPNCGEAWSVVTPLELPSAADLLS